MIVVPESNWNPFISQPLDASGGIDETVRTLLPELTLPTKDRHLAIVG